MTYIPDTNDYRILRQQSRIRHARLKLYDDKLVMLGEIQGDVISGNMNIDSSSDVRRTCSLSVNVKDDSYGIGIDKKIWITRLLNVEIGEYDIVNDDIVFYQAGVFVFDNTSYTFDVTTSTLSLSCSDLMSFLNNARGGKLTSLNTQILYDDYNKDYWYYYYISEGRTAEEATRMAEERASEPRATLNDIIQTTLDQLSFIKGRYLIEDIYDTETGKLATVPYDLSFGVGTTVYEVLSKIRDLYPGWEMFFNEYGVFIYHKIPDYNSEPAFLDNEAISNLVSSEQLSRNFDDIHNCTIVWGSQIETDLFISKENCVSNGNIYTLTEPTPLLVEDGIKFGFVPSFQSSTKQQIKIVNPNGIEVLPPYPIKLLLNNAVFCELPPGYLKANESYIVKFVKTPNITESYYFLYGQYQIYGEFEEHNIYIDSTALQNNSYIIQIDENEYLKRQVCEQYETVIGTSKTQYSFVKDEYHLVNGVKIILVPPVDSIVNQTIKINRTHNGNVQETTGNILLLNNDHKPLKAGELTAGTQYVFQLFHGLLVLQGISINNSRDVISNSKIGVIDLSNPFSVEKIGRIPATFGDSDFSNIGTDELANQRAEYQTNLTVHFNDLIDLTMVTIPWIDICKVKYTSQNTKETHDYLITSVNLSLTAGTMSVSLSRLYNTFI
ncbi:MAG: hypothetical protein RR370_01915 [Synergistaceae bacterium]